MDDGADVIGVLHSAPPRAARRRDRRHGGDDDRRHPAARRSSATASSASPSIAVNEAQHEAPVRQPLRHRPVDDRRDHPRDQRPARRQRVRRRRLRLVRPRRRDAGAGHGRARDRHRGRPDAGARGGDGRLRGDADGRRPPRSATSSAPRPATRTSSRAQHIERMKDGAILANTGHFNVEIEIPALRDARGRDARGARVRRGVHARRRAARLPARRGPARQPRRGRGASGARHGHVLREPGARRRVRRSQNAATLERRVYDVPKEIDDEIARLKLATMGIEIDQLTEEQAQVPRVVGRGDLSRSGRRSHESRHVVPGAGFASRGRRPAPSVRDVTVRELEPHRIVRLEDDAVVVLDQRRLPDEEVELRCRVGGRGRRRDPRRWRSAARRRSAIAAAYGLRARRRARGGPRRGVRDARRVAADGGQPPLGARRDARRPDAASGRERIHEDEVERCRRMGAHAVELVPAGRARPDALQRGRARDGRLRHGARRRARRVGGAGSSTHVWVDETRPLLQGARLTAWELEQLGIPHAVIADGAAASLMARGEVDVRRHRRRPDRGERRHREQDRHLRPRGARSATTGSRSSSSRRRRRSTRRAATGRGDPDRGARPGRGVGALPGAEPCLRRHARRRSIAAIVTEDGVHRAPYADTLPREPAAVR